MKSTTLTATFDTRRDADMAVERLVQEFGMERTDIFVAAAGDENSARGGTGRLRHRGWDAQLRTPRRRRDDAALNGGITVSVDLEDDELAGKVRAVFAEFDASDIVAD